MQSTTTSDLRRCTTCGKSLDAAPYECWLFHSCRSCVAEPAPDRWDRALGTARKWVYDPQWHRENVMDHPVRKGAILRRRHEQEGTQVLVEVIARKRDVDTGEYEYDLTDPTRTDYYTYRAEDLEFCFADTGLTNTEPKARMDEEIRTLYADLHDEHDEHSYHEVHEDGEPAGEQCYGCLKRRGGETA